MVRQRAPVISSETEIIWWAAPGWYAYRPGLQRPEHPSAYPGEWFPVDEEFQEFSLNALTMSYECVSSECPPVCPRAKGRVPNSVCRARPLCLWGSELYHRVRVTEQLIEQDIWASQIYSCSRSIYLLYSCRTKSRILTTLPMIWLLNLSCAARLCEKYEQFLEAWDKFILQPVEVHVNWKTERNGLHQLWWNINHFC